MTLSHIMNRGFGSVLKLLAIVLAIAVATNLLTGYSYQHLLNHETRNATAALSASAALANAIESKQRLLLAEDPDAHQDFALAVETFDRQMDVLQENGIAVDALNADRQVLVDRFQDLQAAMEKRGFERTSGLRGTFRQRAHDLEEALRLHDVDHLSIAFLQVRRYEKDYQRTHAPRYLEKWNAAIDDYQQAVAEMAKHLDGTHESLTLQLEAIDEYRTAQATYLDTVANAEPVAVQDTAYGNVRGGPAKKMAKGLSLAHVPKSTETLLQIRRAEKDYLIRGDHRYLAKAHDLAQGLIEAFRASGVAEEDRTAVEQSIGEYLATLDELAATDQQIAADEAVLIAAVETLVPAMGDIQAASEAALNDGATANLWYGLIGLVAVVALGGFAMKKGKAIARAITAEIEAPVQAIENGLARLAEGDLRVQVDIQGADELVAMGASLNRASADLRQVVSEIREAATTTAASSEELSASAQTISTGAQQQTSQVQDISDSLGSLARAAVSIAEASREAEELSKRTAGDAASGSERVREATDGMQRIAESSDQIKKIIVVISKIAEQTNLLALNAAIEAASAGEHGRGFAVVAEEVRQLAERTSTAASEITDLIEESGRRVNDGCARAEQVGEALTAIVRGVESTTQSMNSVLADTTRQEQTAEQVNEAMQTVSAVTEENSGSAEEMAASSEELSAQAQRLQVLVERFVLDDQPAPNTASGSPTPVAPLTDREIAERMRDERSSNRDEPVLTNAGALYHS